MIACLLCMQEKLNQIRLYSKRGLELNCAIIIAQHFWLKPNAEKNPKERICLVCWRIVREFHQFYVTVAEAHNYLECNEVNYLNKTALDAQSDPLPILVKSEEPCKEECVTSEIKLETNDLEFTPEIEVFETEINKSVRALRATRQSHRKLNANIKSVINKPIKKETCDINDDDSEIELPLSMFLKNISKSPQQKCSRPTKTTTNTVEECADFFANDTKAEENSDNEFESKSEEFTDYNEPIITENSSDAVDSAGLSDIEPPERFAEFAPLRLSEKPKKLRKRIRPTVPYRRMTKEEIKMKHLEQEKYDEIISKFFDNFPCPKCNLLVCTFGEMRKHFNTEHNGNTPSVMCCGRRFPMRKTLAEHVLVHFNPTHFKCSTCKQTFQDSSTLKRHEKTHNELPIEKQIFNCHICTKKLSSKSSLKEHLATKHVPKSEYKFACKECPEKRFPTKAILKKHMHTSHRPGGIVMCEKCGKSMQSSSALRYHIQNEHSSQPRPKPARVECPICKTSLRDESTLKLHIVSIHEESGGEYRCHICGYLSVNARALKRHIGYNHEAERKFKCTMCDKAFKRSDTLKEHISTHTGEGLYTCPECLMTFACKANFHKHKQRRHGHKPVKRNLVGLAEKKRQKLNTTKKEQNEHLSCYATEENMERNVTT